MQTSFTALSVNLNKVALVRNTRHLGIPSVTRAAALCLEAGASGITVHPRPDARHIRGSDVLELAQLMQDWPGREFNVEGNPLHNLMDVAADLVARNLPLHQLTFVPDGEGQLTSDHGWSFPQDDAVLRPLIAQSQAWGVRVSLFMDAEADAMAGAKAVGADRVELYTEPYAAVWGSAGARQVQGREISASQAVLAALQAGCDMALLCNQSLIGEPGDSPLDTVLSELKQACDTDFYQPETESHARRMSLLPKTASLDWSSMLQSSKYQRALLALP